MAITLVTGVPGSSKTLNTIREIDKEWGESGRPIFYFGIKELILPWTELTIDQVNAWWDLPTGSVIVLDEVQQVWPGRPNNRPVPEAVQRLDTHRHGGYDFYVITQRYTMVDHHLRGFVGRHLHFERQFGFEGAKRSEWQKCVDPEDFNVKDEALTTRVKFDKKYYGVYHSAEVHTVKKRIPAKVYGILGLIGLVGLLGWSVLGTAREYGDPADQLVNDDSPIRIIPNQEEWRPGNQVNYSEQWTPRVPDVPHSAPAFDQVTEVKTFPRPQCMYHHRTDRCKCFTQQATPLDISRATCMNYVHNGWFNPYLDEEAQRAEALADRAPDNDPQPGNPKPGKQIVVLGDSGIGNVPRI